MHNDKLLKNLANQYVDLLKDRDIEHPAIMLSFSGIPGSDKTSLARKLAKDLQAQWVQHDDMRHFTASLGYDPRKLSMVIMSTLAIDKIVAEDANKFIVLDLSIDRTWERFYEYTDTHKMKPIVIRLNIPLPLLRKKLAEREDRKFDADRFEEFVMDFETCKKHVKADFELDEKYDYDELLAGIKNLIR